MNSPVRLGVSPTTTIPTGFYSQRFRGFISLHWNRWLHCVSHSQLFLPVICMQVWDCPVHQPPPCPPHQPPPCHRSFPPQPISTTPTSLNECFFFNSLVVGLPCSSIFWKFWLFFCLNWLFPSFVCTRRQSISTYPSILARSKSSPQFFSTFDYMCKVKGQSPDSCPENTEAFIHTKCFQKNLRLIFL